MNILLAVSGGIDSMYMAERALDGALFANSSFAVAHCNFSLRGEESDGDEQFVRQWCNRTGTPLFCKRFDTAAYAKSGKISIEMAARELRYGWFSELCQAEGFDAVAVAHNARDNAETLMLNLLRGTGTRGIRGIAKETTINGVRVLRPILDTDRTEIEAWMKKNGKCWREDSTNSESEVKRNKLRNEVFPVFAQINPSFVRTMADNMERFAQADDILEDYYQQALPLVMDGPGRVKIPALLEFKHWKYLLWRILEGCSLNHETFEKMTTLLEAFATKERGTVTMSGKTFQASGHCVVIRKKILTFD